MTIFLDIGATLIEGPAKSPSRFLADRLGLDEETRLHIEHYLLTHVIDSVGDLIRYLSSEHRLTYNRVWNTVISLWRSQVEDPRIVDGAESLLNGLYSIGADYGFISNIWYPYQATFSQLFGPLAHRELSFFSYLVGRAKPDVRLYKHAITRCHKPPGSCVMVGDSYETDIAPAMEAGMKTVWVLHRIEKEKRFYADVVAGRRPPPSLVVSSIRDISPMTLLTLSSGKPVR